MQIIYPPHMGRPSGGKPILILWACTRSRLQCEFPGPSHFVPCIPDSAADTTGVMA